MLVSVRMRVVKCVWCMGLIYRERWGWHGKGVSN